MGFERMIHPLDFSHGGRERLKLFETIFLLGDFLVARQHGKEVGRVERRE